MEYREFGPHPYLAVFVECIWTLVSDPGRPAGAAERILPDGCLEIVINCAEPFLEYGPDGSVRKQARIFVAAEMEGALMVGPSGPADIIGIRFRPGGAWPFLDAPLNEICRSSTLCLGDVAAPLQRNIVDAVCSDRLSPAERITVLQSILLARLAQNPVERDTALEAAVEKIVRTGGCIGLPDLSGALGVSERQLERKFKRRVGVGPKALARIMRFQNIFRAMDRDDSAGFSALAYECGYYDQAHFIREFRRFSGQNPTAYFARRYEMAHHFLRKNRVSEIYNHL